MAIYISMWIFVLASGRIHMESGLGGGGFSDKLIKSFDWFHWLDFLICERVVHVWTLIIARYFLFVL